MYTVEPPVSDQQNVELRCTWSLMGGGCLRELSPQWIKLFLHWNVVTSENHVPMPTQCLEKVNSQF